MQSLQKDWRVGRCKSYFSRTRAILKNETELKTPYSCTNDGSKSGK